MFPLAWVTGAGGLIGSHISRAVADAPESWQVRALTRGELDLCDFAAVDAAFDIDRPQLVIHCAALTQNPACQKDPLLARRINVDATAHLAHLAAEIPFIFFSTDLVFDGQTGGYKEWAPVHPLTVYAETKVAAEQVVLSNPLHTVLRTALTAGCSPTGDRAFDEQLRLAWRRGEKPKLFTDEFRCPIGADIIARAVWELIAKRVPGLFHLAGTERLSRFEIGQLLAARSPELHPQVEPGSLKDYTGPVRSPDTSLNSEEVQKLLSFPLPGFRQWLEAH